MDETEIASCAEDLEGCVHVRRKNFAAFFDDEWWSSVVKKMRSGIIKPSYIDRIDHLSDHSATWQESSAKKNSFKNAANRNLSLMFV